MITLKYTISKEDYIHFYTYAVWDSADRKKSRFKNILRQLAFVAAFLAIYYFAGGFRFLNRFSIIIILLMFATSLLPLFGGRSNTNKQAEEIADDPDNASVFVDNFLTASDAGLEIKNEISDTKYSWAAVIKRTETEDHYFLFLNAIYAVIIPKRSFDSKEQQAEFNKILIKNLSLQAEVKGNTDAGK